jgi:hypothetical protein
VNDQRKDLFDRLMKAQSWAALDAIAAEALERGFDDVARLASSKLRFRTPISLTKRIRNPESPADVRTRLAAELVAGIAKAKTSAQCVLLEKEARRLALTGIADKARARRQALHDEYASKRMAERAAVSKRAAVIPSSNVSVTLAKVNADFAALNSRAADLMKRIEFLEAQDAKLLGKKAPADPRSAEIAAFSKDLERYRPGSSPFHSITVHRNP